jgi:hypothetical protein
MLNSLIGIIASSGGVTSTNSYESIATTTVGAGGSSSITFSSIPSSYQHLQIRVFGRTTNSVSSESFENTIVSFNSDTTNANYAWHNIVGDGASVTANGFTSNRVLVNAVITGNLIASSIYGTFVTDILDYSNTSKYKTTRSLAGGDANGSGRLMLQSSLWMNTAAITSITLTNGSGNNFVQYSSFALYGIKG